MITIKSIITTLIFLNLYVYGISQSSGTVNFHLGASASTYYTSQKTFYKRDNARPNYYPTVGVSYDFLRDNKSFLSTGLSLQRQGWRKESRVLNPDDDTFLVAGELTYVMDYLVIDAVYNVPFNRLYLGLGTHIGYVVNRTFKSNGRATNIVGGTLIYPQATPQLDFGINSQVGFYLSRKEKRTIALEVKYNLGLRGLYQHNNNYFQNLFRNQLLAVSIVYGINK